MFRIYPDDFVSLLIAQFVVGAAWRRVANGISSGNERTRVEVFCSTVISGLGRMLFLATSLFDGLRHGERQFLVPWAGDNLHSDWQALW
jgi:hypothetical protein